MKKIRVFVYSLKGVSPVEYVDMESARHPCSQAGERVFSGLERFPQGNWDSWDSILPEEQRKVVHLVRDFSEEKGLELEIVDLADSGFISTMKSLIKGKKAPSVAFKEKIIRGAPTKEELESLLHK